MKKKNSQIRGIARENLLGKYKVPICAFLIVEILTILCSAPFERMTQTAIVLGNTGNLIIGLVGSAIVTWLAIALSIGICSVHLAIARGREATVLMIFQPLKNNANRIMGLSAVYLIAEFICELPGGILISLSGDSLMQGDLTSLPLVFIGSIITIILNIVLIILMLSWSQAYFLILDHPEKTVKELLHESILLMKGHKLKLFGLILSFIGYLLLSVLTIFIALLWIIPYINQSMSQFYLELVPDTMRNDASETI